MSPTPPEIKALPVTLVPVLGSPLAANVPLRRTGLEGETLGERLEDAASSFLPVEIDGHTELLRLAWLAYVRVDAGAPEVEKLEQLGARRESVSIRLTTGERLDGDVLYILPPDRQRISDLLNASDWRFLLLHVGSSVCFVHRDAIATVLQR